MGLSGGILKRVFSKSRSREFNERSSSENSTQKNRWVNSVRIYLCGDEVNSHPLEEEDEADLQEETHLNVISKQNSNSETSKNEVVSEMHEEINTEEVQLQEISLQEEKAAICIQSAFKGLMVRRILKEMKKIEEIENKDEFYENTESRDEFYENTDCATVATSTEVQIGESFNTLRLSEDTVSFQHREFSKGRPPVFRVKEEWDDSTLSRNAAKIRMQNRLEATTRRERALAYAFSQQLRTCTNTKKRSSQCDMTEENLSWSWLERWMATKNPETCNPLPDDCMSKNLEEFFIPSNRKTILIKNKRLDVSFEGKESCGSNDVSVNFEGFNANSTSATTITTGGNKIGKNRSKNAPKNVPRKKGEVENHHGLNSRLKKVSRKEHGKQEEVTKECDNSQPSNESSTKSK